MTVVRETPHPLTDVHAHFVTGDYVAAARDAGIAHPDGMPGWPSFDLGDQLRLMDERGIDRALLSISSPGVHFGDDTAARDLARSVNDTAAGFCARHPDRIGFLASLPLPEVGESVAEARRAIDELGAAGVIVLSNARGRYLGNPAFEPLWETLDQRGAVVLTHPTSPAGSEWTSLNRPAPMIEFLFDTTRTVVDLILAGVLRRHPAVRVVVPHSGAALPVLSDRIAMFSSAILGTDGAEWAEGFRSLWFDTAGTPFPIAVPALARVVGADRVVYGSDSCWTPSAAIEQQLRLLDAAPAPEGHASWRALVGLNTRGLLGRPLPHSAFQAFQHLPQVTAGAEAR